MEATDTDFLMEAMDALTEATDFLMVATDAPTEDMVAMDVATTASVRLTPSPRLMLMLRLIPTSDTDTLVATDSATEVTPVDTLVATPALDTLDLVTLVDSATDTAVATDISDKKVPVLKSAKALNTSVKQNDYS